MGVHHRAKSRAASSGWPAQEVGNLFAVAVPLRVGLLLRRVVTGFRGVDQIDGDREVRSEQLRECGARGLTVIDGHRRTDVGLGSDEVSDGATACPKFVNRYRTASTLSIAPHAPKRPIVNGLRGGLFTPP